MFILKRTDVEITTVQHPSKDQQIPVLNYQGQTFRLMKMFSAQQAEEARALWRDLTDNKGKACVLLEESDRYSVWGKVRLDQLLGEGHGGTDTKLPILTQACLLLLQAVYFDIEDLLGAKQAGSFEKDLIKIFQKSKFPQADHSEAIKTLLTLNPLDSLHIPPWQENHLCTLLQELYKLGKGYFGNTSFAEGIEEVLEDLSPDDRDLFINWLSQSALDKLWIMN
ncbi:hypothetical protein PCC9214_02150 [Planktothrix tepida]|uniref:Uncharacterized protein n=3 Tax=Planktothrix TaxID=54304 RepID=A0A1J1LJY3_9CYAN|nr:MULTISPECIES: Npun_F0813 family protein [Planktothrix]MBD2485662.1 hypothetical protein [Planktothrix sp. FACHB-1365]MBE9144124.1 hypothetical protein [Planktothrix mougeotii LEGE 06226]CAD5944536.1 hypothetical protein PCC9214_02150 [Planktothrix tepida]CAD5966567.1 hypothetical protein NO713_03542 [Planktothrix pseudagardhii]CUR32885.1 conserved hypothetical protein [Planktothrix tepida PCC 9214]